MVFNIHPFLCSIYEYISTNNSLMYIVPLLNWCGLAVLWIFFSGILQAVYVVQCTVFCVLIGWTFCQSISLLCFLNRVRSSYINLQLPADLCFHSTILDLFESLNKRANVKMLTFVSKKCMKCVLRAFTVLKHLSS